MNVKSFIFGFVVGGSICGSAAFFVGKKIVKKSAEEEISKREQAAWQYFKDKYAPKNIDIQKEEPSEIVKKFEMEDYAKRAEVYDTRSSDFAEMEHPMDSDEDENDAPDDYYDEDKEKLIAVNEQNLPAIAYDKRNMNHTPEIIADVEYGAAPGYDTEEVTYYTENKAFVNDTQSMIIDDNDLEYLFGPGIEAVNFKNDPNQLNIYIRNYHIQTDYCISKTFGSYTE